jgi:transcription initiation factor TFIIH subunit 4
MSDSSLRSFEYLESLPGTVFIKLYQSPSTALAVFRRMLPHMGAEISRVSLCISRADGFENSAKTIVMAMLYMSRPLPVTDLESWVRPDSKM